MTDRLVAWANLTASARAFATKDDDETKRALSSAARAWAAVDMPKPASVSMGDAEPTVRFGRDKGKRLSEVKDLSWYRAAIESSVADESKARWRQANEAHLAEIDAEMEGRA